MDELEAELRAAFQEALDRSMSTRPEFDAVAHYLPVSIPEWLSECRVVQQDVDGKISYFAQYLVTRPGGSLGLEQGKDMELELDPREDSNLEQIRASLQCVVDEGPRGLALGVRQFFKALISAGVSSSVLHDVVDLALVDHVMST